MNGIPQFKPTFNSLDYQKMAEEGFKPIFVWSTYEESEYAKYEKKTGYTQKYLELARQRRERGEDNADRY
jgi:hypothetical protein